MHALSGMCALNIFEYEISLSCGKFRNHHREPLFGHGNTFNRGRPVVASICTIGEQRNKSKREGREGGAIVAVSAEVGEVGWCPNMTTEKKCGTLP